MDTKIYISGKKLKFDDIKHEILQETGKYYNLLVFDAESSTLWTRGKSYGISVQDLKRIADLESAVELLKEKGYSISEEDKVLSVIDGALQTTLSLEYNQQDKQILLKGNDDAVVAELDVTELAKGNAITGGELVETAEQGIEVAAPYIKLTVNDGEYIRISVKSLLNIYDAANIRLTEGYLAKQEFDASAIKAGASIEEVVSELVAAVQNKVASIGGKTGALTLKGSLTDKGSINLQITDDGEISATIVGLGTAAFSDSADYATSAQGANAESAIQSIKIGDKTLTKEDNTLTGDEILACLDLKDFVRRDEQLDVTSDEGNYIKVSLGGTNGKPIISVTEKIQQIESASTERNGLALAADVKANIEALSEDFFTAIETLSRRVKVLEDNAGWEEV